MCARPKSSSRALLRLCTREPTHHNGLVAGVLPILWTIDRYKRSQGCHRYFTQAVKFLMPRMQSCTTLILKHAVASINCRLQSQNASEKFTISWLSVADAIYVHWSFFDENACNKMS